MEYRNVREIFPGIGCAMTNITDQKFIVTFQVSLWMSL